MSINSLTVHDTGPDGESTYDLVIGSDIAADVAEEVIRKSGGFEVYAMHHYEAGERVENFISKAMYDKLRAEIAPITSHLRRIDEVKADNAKMVAKAEQVPSPLRPRKPWWAIWR